ncbi:MAG TPA: OsmC family protein [Candidatus Deferrimicrobium sp.]|nr:OsmC family protein [Candidatus Deferrimicrobium sp.]
MSFEQTIETFKKDNSKGERKFNVRIEDNGAMSFKISMGEKPHVVLTGSPPGLGGDDKGASPLLLTLGVIGACIGTVIKFWAKLMKVKIDDIDISMRGNINLCGIFGIGDHKAAFTDLKPVVRITTSEDEAKINELLKNVDAHCLAYLLIRDANPIEWDVKIKK